MKHILAFYLPTNRDKQINKINKIKNEKNMFSSLCFKMFHINIGLHIISSWQRAFAAPASDSRLHTYTHKKEK